MMNFAQASSCFFNGRRQSRPNSVEADSLLRAKDYSSLDNRFYLRETAGGPYRVYC